MKFIGLASKCNSKVWSRLDDVQAKLENTEREAEQARKDSKKARDEFSAIKKQRFG